jgi:hypothetical protein
MRTRTEAVEALNVCSIGTTKKLHDKPVDSMRDVLSRILKDDPDAAKQMWETALSYFDTPTAAIQVRRGKKDSPE